MTSEMENSAVAGLDRNGKGASPSAPSTALKKPFLESMSHRNKVDTDTTEMMCGVNRQVCTHWLSRGCRLELSQAAMSTASTIVMTTVIKV